MTTKRQAWKRIDLLERRAWLGSSPFEDDSPVRQAVRWARGWVDIGWWFRTYLGHYFRDESPEFHRELIKVAEEAMWAAIAAARGHGKSTVFTFGHSLYELCLRRFRYEQLISSTKPDAEEFVMGIKEELEDNDRIRRDYGHLQGEAVWYDDEFITAVRPVVVPVFTPAELAEALTDDDIEALAELLEVEATAQAVAEAIVPILDEVRQALADERTMKVQAFGRGQRRIRGRKHGPWRPDRIKLDDVEDDEQAANPDTTLKVIKWFWGAVRPGLEPRTGRCTVIGTILGTYTLLNELLRRDKYKRFTKHSFPAIVTDPETGEERAIWEERKPLAELLEDREDMGEAEFSKEYLCEAPDEESKPFPTDLDEYEYFGVVDLEDRRLDTPVVWCDPALGRNRHSDSPAILVEQWDSKEGVLFCLELDVAIRRPENTIRECIRLMKEYGLLSEAARYEDVGFQELMQNLHEKIATEDGDHGYFACGFPVPAGDKDTRITSISYPVRRGKVRFRRGQKPALRQFVRQPKGRKDAPDLVATAYKHHAAATNFRVAYRGQRRRMTFFGRGAF